MDAFDFRRQIAFDLRPHLLLSAEDQSQPGVRRPDRRYQANRRADLARQLYRLRSRILRRRDLQARTPCKSLRIKSVAHVFGIIRNPCVRYGPYRNGALGEIRTPDPRNRNPMLYPAELRAPKYFERVGTPTSRLLVGSGCSSCEPTRQADQFAFSGLLFKPVEAALQAERVHSLFSLGA